MAKSTLEINKEYPTCFVCGCKNTGAYSISIRQTRQTKPYFPFLDTHELPDGAEQPSPEGTVLSCYTCYAFLNQQWESYEKNNVPLVKRIYWMKRVDNGPYTGVEMGMQSEYASQVFGLTSEYSGTIENKKQDSPITFRKPVLVDRTSSLDYKPHVIDEVPSCFKTNLILTDQELQQEALDLSLDSNKRKDIENCCDQPNKVRAKYPHVKNVESLDVLDLSMPDKDATTEVCYICGNHFKKGMLVGIYAKTMCNVTPFFPSLMLHPRPSGSRPMESSGKVLGCKKCLTFLLGQWQKYEEQCIPFHQRIYHLKQKEYNEKNSNLSDLSVLPSKDKSSEICFKIEDKSEGKCTLYSSSDLHINEDENIKNIHRSLNKNLANENEDSFDGIVCCLCHQSFAINQLQTLSMVPDKTNSSGMFFPFLKFLPQINQNMITEDGRILVCKACHIHLSSQWAEYEKDNVPEDQRHFSLRTLVVSSQSPRLTPGSHHTPLTSSSHSSTPEILNTSNCTSHIPLSIYVNEEVVKKAAKKVIEGYHGQPLKELEVVAATSESDSIALPAITTQRSLNININCYVCGFYSKAGQTYAVNSKLNGKELFFPFLNKHITAYPNSIVDDATFLVCSICFHSLVIQWQHYEKNRIEFHARFYDTHNFTCFICSTKTYRKRLYFLPVKDYPFLKDHIRPSCGMVVNNGHSVVVCKDCFVSLNEQYTELERWGVPVEKRQYNWIKRPPPPEFPLTTQPFESKVSLIEPSEESVLTPTPQPGDINSLCKDFTSNEDIKEMKLKESSPSVTPLFQCRQITDSDQDFKTIHKIADKGTDIKCCPNSGLDIIKEEEIKVESI